MMGNAGRLCLSANPSYGIRGGNVPASPKSDAGYLLKLLINRP
jgi:hypothetical protein